MISVAYDTPLNSDCPWHLTTSAFNPIKIPQLWTRGSSLSFTDLRDIEDSKYPNFEINELL